MVHLSERLFFLKMNKYSHTAGCWTEACVYVCVYVCLHLMAVFAQEKGSVQRTPSMC